MTVPALVRRLLEHFDAPYRYEGRFRYGPDGHLAPVQVIRFQSDDGARYAWQARQNPEDPTSWDVSFGTFHGVAPGGEPVVSTSLTKRGKPFRILATVLDIIRYFADDAGEDVRELTLDSEGEKRTALYLSRLAPLLDDFEVADVRTRAGTSHIVVRRR